MRKPIKYFFALSAFFVLTVLTQVGGVILLLGMVVKRLLFRSSKGVVASFITNSLVFLAVYTAGLFLIVPPLARWSGRVALPMVSDGGLAPLNSATCLLFRNYVRPSLAEATRAVAEKLNAEYPNTTLSYLDASFPFFDGFPLLPHKSHDDGEKIDLAFFYRGADDAKVLDRSAPSAIGYGVYESPKPGEQDMASACAEKGYWQYGILERLVPQGEKGSMVLEEARTAAMVELFAANDAIGKIFIEPHLKDRMGLNHPKVRFHGCGAVRHDDHVHVELK